MLLLSTSALASEPASGIAFWLCPPTVQNLYVRLAAYEYTGSLYVPAGQINDNDLPGSTLLSKVKICSDGAQCVEAQEEVHFDRLQHHKLTGRFKVPFPNGEVMEQTFEVKLRSRSKKDVCE